MLTSNYLVRDYAVVQCIINTLIFCFLTKSSCLLTGYSVLRQKTRCKNLALMKSPSEDVPMRKAILLVTLPAFNPRARKIPLLLVMFVSMALIGCIVNTPINVGELKIEAPSELTLPIEAEVRIDLSQQERSRMYTVSCCGRPRLSAGSPMLSAAIKTFRRGFSNVTSSADQKSHLVVRAKSEVKTSSVTGIHSANVIARIQKPDGAVIGEFVGSGSEISGAVAHPIALENAFIKAFIEILSQLMTDNEFLTLVRGGYFKMPPKNGNF